MYPFGTEKMKKLLNGKALCPVLACHCLFIMITAHFALIKQTAIQDIGVNTYALKFEIPCINIIILCLEREVLV